MLVERAHPPYQGHYALPGGFVELEETVEMALRREVKEETNLDLEGDLELLGVYSKPDRDPRGHVVSICFLARGSGKLESGSDAHSVVVFQLNDLPALAFDHRQMISDAERRLKKL